MGKNLRDAALADLNTTVNFDELERGSSNSRTGNDNQFIKRIGANDYLFNRVTVPADRIVSMVSVHKLNPRKQMFLNEISLAKLMRDVKSTGGIQQPPICIYEDGIYETIDGSRRTKVSELLGLPLTLEYTCDVILESDIAMYITATDSNENQSAYENAIDLFNRYIDMKSEWEKTTLEKWKDEAFLLEANISGSTLTRTKKIINNLDNKFFEKGDPNKFAARDLVALCGLVSKQIINHKEVFYDKINTVFERCLHNYGEEWEFENFKAEFSKEFGLKPLEKQQNKVMCVLTMEDGDDIVELNVLVNKKKKSFSVELPFQYSDEAAEKIKAFVIATFDNN